MVNYQRERSSEVWSLINGGKSITSSELWLINDQWGNAAQIAAIRSLINGENATETHLLPTHFPPTSFRPSLPPQALHNHFLPPSLPAPFLLPSRPFLLPSCCVAGTSCWPAPTRTHPRRPAKPSRVLWWTPTAPGSTWGGRWGCGGAPRCLLSALLMAAGSN